MDIHQAPKPQGGINCWYLPMDVDDVFGFIVVVEFIVEWFPFSFWLKYSLWLYGNFNFLSFFLFGDLDNIVD